MHASRSRSMARMSATPSPVAASTSGGGGASPSFSSSAWPHSWRTTSRTSPVFAQRPELRKSVIATPSQYALHSEG